jgi:hypothetical protein
VIVIGEEMTKIPADKLGEYLELLKEKVNSEAGTEEPCPFCYVPRVMRRSYIRCNQCGVNWLDEERTLSPDYLNKDPRLSRPRAVQPATSSKSASMSAVASTNGTARPASIEDYTLPSIAPGGAR